MDEAGWLFPLFLQEKRNKTKMGNKNTFIIKYQIEEGKLHKEF